MAKEEVSNENNSYRQIMKATSIFGGVQVFNIVISILRSKIIALLLGPSGMGIAGLLTSTTTFIGSLTNFGLGISSVKDIAAAYGSGDELEIAKVITVVRRLVWFTGLLGSIVTFFLAPWLSDLSFGNAEYSFAFRWLSITLLFTQLTSGQYVLLQGLRRLNYLAKANMLGSAFGLLVSAPLYYYYQIDGIVPAIILTTIITLVVTKYFSGKIKIAKVDVSIEDTKLRGKGMMIMGFMLSLSGIMVVGASYVIRIFISNTGGIEDVGLFSAGFAIINTYVGLVFTAMSTDYYPRLSGVAHNNAKARIMINQQADIAILILSPVLVVFLIFINWIVILLYSTKFAPIDTMLHWMALGMYFKAASWSIAFILLAKGASKLFFWNELASNIYGLGLNLLGYHLMGLEGLGISFLINYVLYFIQVLLLSKYKYKFEFSPEFYKIFILQFSLALICFGIIKFVVTPWAYLCGLPFIIVSSWYSFKELDKRIDIKSIISKFIKKGK
ncbi:O-antigen translocase [Maribacter sp. PR1]|uniref:O-antigen translocase n=1 Tax=Maribacter cobaltidurans TaxID=1178778 RepID=A0ABU7IWF3_9FLAO|nr:MULTISPECIES: O-antigen translocase [Maribacter]MDC6389768.1 O-antigen translocase [Maribacter sp. PR1]MEE1977158.1 O-antigen translocase [Maribacter cobaltidurans]